MIEAGVGLSPDDHRGRLAENRELLRGSDQGPIGEDEEPGPDELFFMEVCRAIPYYRHPAHVKNALAKLGLSYDPAQEDSLLDSLDQYARQRADEKAGQVPLPMGEPA